MNIDHIIFAQPISTVWQALGGDAPRNARARAFYRAGDNQRAVALDDAKGCWFDHRDSVGGGILDLIQHVRGCDRSAALRWLADLNGMPFDDLSFNAADRRQYERQRAKADQLARDVADFAQGLELFLERHQQDIAAVVTWLLTHDIDPGDVLDTSISDLAVLRSSDADSLVQAYRELPEPLRRTFREVGQRDRESAEHLTHAIVGMLVEFDSTKAVA